MSQPDEAYLDTNAASDLFRTGQPAEERVRSAMREAALAGRYTFVSSDWTVQELCGIAKHDWPKCQSVIGYLLEVTEGRLIVPAAELIERELVYGRRLRRDERLASRELIGRLREAMTTPEMALEVYAEHRAIADESARDTRERCERILRELSALNGGDPRHKVLTWWRDGDERIADWSRDALPARMRAAGFDEASARFYPLYLVPTLRNFIAQMLARLVWNAGKGKPIKPSDDADTHQYAAACYADVFLTTDQALSGIIGLIPPPRKLPITMGEFAERELGIALPGVSARSRHPRPRAANEIAPRRANRRRRPR